MNYEDAVVVLQVTSCSHLLVVLLELFRFHASAISGATSRNPIGAARPNIDKLEP